LTAHQSDHQPCAWPCSISTAQKCICWGRFSRSTLGFYLGSKRNGHMRNTLLINPLLPLPFMLSNISCIDLLHKIPPAPKSC
jgi:hypothetical protein